MKNHPQSWVVDFVLWLGCGLTGLFLTYTFNEPIALYKFGANSWPAVINVLIIVCIIVYSAHCLFVKHKTDGEESEENSVHLKEIFVPAIVPLMYVFSLQYIGFYVGTLIFIPLYTYSIKRKDIKKILYICIPAACMVEIIFTKFLFVPFPVGTLPFLYDINSAVAGWLY